MITFEHVEFYYRPEQPILKHLHFTIHQGEFVSIVGANGSGKSTLSKLINGLLLPKKGSVQYNELRTNNPRELEQIRQQIGFIFQNPDDQFITTTVQDEIIFGLENIRLPKEEMDERVMEALSLVGMESSIHAMPHELSGGQKQRVAIAAILAMKPKVIIFDEATSMLDPLGRQQILSIMKDLHEKGMTIIHITHHMDEVLEADRLLLIHEGEICYDGNPLTFFAEVNVRDYQLVEPFAVRLHQFSNKGIRLSADWKGAIQEKWATN